MKKSDLATRWRGILGLIGTLAIFNRWEAQVEELRKDLPEKFNLGKRGPRWPRVDLKY